MKINDLKVGVFLVIRYLKRANPWTTALITFVMLLTFLNLTVIGGILEGIVVGSFEGLRDRAIGDVFISPKTGEKQVERTQQILSTLKSDARVKAFAPRVSARAEVIPKNEFHKITDARVQRKEISTSALGIDADAERQVTNLPASIIEGSYFSSNKARREVLIGSGLLERYSPFGADVLSEVYPGEAIYVRLEGSDATGVGFGENENGRRSSGGVVAENQDSVTGVLQKYKVQGIFRTKAGELDLTIVFNDDEVKAASPLPGNNVTSIAIRLHDADDAIAVKQNLLNKGYGKYAKIETTDDAIGSFLNDIRTVFQLLGSVVGAIGLAVASITIFIIIFVTALSRSKYIGILKAIGITPSAIRVSYLLYALFFAILGTLLGLAVLYGLLVPFFIQNPIPFPFSDGILFTTPTRTTLYVALILIATTIAGFIPANHIIKKPAIDAVRGR